MTNHELQITYPAIHDWQNLRLAYHYASRGKRGKQAAAAMEPVFERGFIYDSYANRVGKGTHRALDRASLRV
jgi:hypothetical protein